MTKTMTYEENATLQLPMHYVVIENDEMEYLDGGSWNTFRGGAALSQLSVIAGQAFDHAVAAGTLAKVAGIGVAAGKTGVGLVVAVAAALGTTLAIASTGIHAAWFGLALSLFVADGAFDHWGFSIWNWSVTLGVRTATRW
jgi:hypothetical protein